MLPAKIKTPQAEGSACERRKTNQSGKLGDVEPHPVLKGLTTADDKMPRTQTTLDISLKHTHCIHGITVHNFQSTKR
jgi:hypothetical protein